MKNELATRYNTRYSIHHNPQRNIINYNSVERQYTITYQNKNIIRGIIVILIVISLFVVGKSAVQPLSDLPSVTDGYTYEKVSRPIMCVNSATNNEHSEILGGIVQHKDITTNTYTTSICGWQDDFIWLPKK